MPQFIGVIIALLVVPWIVAGIIWVVQWIWAVVAWIFAVFLIPFFVFFTPGVLVLLVSASIYWGSWVAAQNYFLSLKTNVHSESLTGKLTRNYIITILTLFLIIIYVLFAIISLVLTYEPAQMFVFRVIDHYQSIKFPAFRIHFPFWDY